LPDGSSVWLKSRLARYVVRLSLRKGCNLQRSAATDAAWNRMGNDTCGETLRR
jgi:hypothetical protein